MSNDRYVILNCPTLMGNRLCYGKTIKQCADCTNCVMKQIYEICKDDALVGGIDETAEKVVDLLDIQEVE